MATVKKKQLRHQGVVDDAEVTELPQRRRRRVEARSRHLALYPRRQLLDDVAKRALARQALHHQLCSQKSYGKCTRINILVTEIHHGG
eukprot:SAG11_NODE_7596_length_1123_cov_4.546875_2_plen_88_part_00